MGEEEKNLKIQYVIFKCVQFPNVNHLEKKIKCCFPKIQECIEKLDKVCNMLS